MPQPFLDELGPDAQHLTYLGIVTALVLGSQLVINHSTNSPFDRLLKDIRDGEKASKMLGKRTNRVTLMSFGLDGAVASLAGGAYAHCVGTVTPQQFVTEITIFA